MRYAILVVLVGFMLVSSQPILACSCRFSNDPLESFKTANAVFVGKVLSVEPIKYIYEVKLQVDDAFKGVEPGEITIYTEMVSVACGYNFTVGENYLVYAEKDAPEIEIESGKLSVNKCGRTRQLAEAGADIAAIKRYLEEQR